MEYLDSATWPRFLGGLRQLTALTASCEAHHVSYRGLRTAFESLIDLYGEMQQTPQLSKAGLELDGRLLSYCGKLDKAIRNHMETKAKFEKCAEVWLSEGGQKEESQNQTLSSGREVLIPNETPGT